MHSTRYLQNLLYDPPLIWGSTWTRLSDTCGWLLRLKTNAVPLSITITITNSVDALVWPGTNTTVSGGYFIKGNGGTVTISFPLADQRAWRGAGLGGTALGTYIREYR